MEKIRQLVSKNKRRYQENGFDLDLTYIYPNIIAMGFPAEKLEGVYRNPVDDVLRFLDSMHKDHYRVYNLCDERKYEGSKFHNRLVMFPFHDHCPPPIELFDSFCKDLDGWLGAHPDNIAAIHCKAGKGRTGVMICAYMLHRHIFVSAEEALEYYGKTRTRDGKGVTIPSQRRYVEYYGELIKSNRKYEKRALPLSKVKFETIPHLNNGTFNVNFDIIQNQVKMFSSQTFEPCNKDEKELTMQLQSPCMVCGDVCIEFFHKPSKFVKKERIFQCWFNTYFVRTVEEESTDGKSRCKYLVLSMKKSELDKANKDKANKIYGKNFQVKFYFVHPIESKASINGDIIDGSFSEAQCPLTPIESGNSNINRSKTDGSIKAMGEENGKTSNGSVPGRAPGRVHTDYSRQGGTTGSLFYTDNLSANRHVTNPYTKMPVKPGASDRLPVPPYSQSVPEFKNIQDQQPNIDKHNKQNRSIRNQRLPQAGARTGNYLSADVNIDALSLGDSDPEDLSDTETEDEWETDEVTSV